MEFAAFAGVIFFTLMFRRERLMIRAFVLSVMISVTAFFGARLFHLLFERPLADFRWDQMLYFDGMTFYGSFLFGGAAAVFLTRLLFPRAQFRKISDLAALVSATLYGFLRIGCFCNGCCWGRLTSVPWAVRYNSGSEMPFIGLPVHPVQLYDSFFGFLIAILLIVLYRKGRYKGALMPVFLVLYSIGRFITEFFRGDSYRGTDVMFHLSTSQTISMFLFFLGLIWLFFYFRRPLGPSQETRS